MHLLDVNVLMALLWENHEHHQRARSWLHGVSAFATCPLVQLGFARISAHPMLGYGMAPDEAFAILRRFLADSRYHFIADDLSCTDRVLHTENIPNSNYVTDHYLVALARQHNLTLATLDEPLSRSFSHEPGLVTLIS
jgi:toxin-antitoxin system PIN domain toxin